MALTATSSALLRGLPAPEVAPAEAEREALRLAALLGRGEYAAALSEPLAAKLLEGVPRYACGGLRLEFAFLSFFLLFKKK